MIGTKIISEHHLYKLATHIPQVVLFCCNYEWNFGLVFLRSAHNQEDNTVVLFNRRINDCIDNYEVVSREYGRTFCENLPRFMVGRSVAFHGKNSSMTFLSAHISEMILLPDSFFAEFETFQNSNKKALGRNLISQFTIDTLSPNFAYIYCLTHASKNLYAWAFKTHIYGVRLSVIKEIVLWYEKYGGILSKGLKKATITAYSGYDQVLGLINEIRQLRQDKEITDIMNSFNTSQKKILKNVELNKLSQAERCAFGKFGQLSLSKRQNFIRKMSTVDDAYEIVRQMCFLTSSHFDWNITSFMEFLRNAENLKCHIVSNENGVVLLSVEDFDTIKKLAKTTNWCISKNKSYWNNYTRGNNAIQYVLFDFTKPEDDLLSIIGFTSVESKGISAAHDFKNNNMMGRDNQQILYSELSRYLPSNIFNVLANANIALDKVIALPNAPKAWNKESLLKLIYKHINPYAIKVIKDENNQMCIEVRDKTILDIFYSRPDEEFPLELTDSEYNYGYKFLIFADFGQPYTNNSAFVVSIVVENMYGEERPNYTFHALMSMITVPTFDELLTRYNMPYDTIRRIGNDDATFVRQFNEYGISFNSCSNNVEKLKRNIDALRKTTSREELGSIIEYSITSLSSLDYVKMIYATNNTLMDVCGECLISHLISWLNTLLRGNRGQNNGQHWELSQLVELRDGFITSNKAYNYEQARIGNALMMIDYILTQEQSANRKFAMYISRVTKEIHNLQSAVALYALSAVCKESEELKKTLEVAKAYKTTFNI